MQAICVCVCVSKCNIKWNKVLQCSIRKGEPAPSISYKKCFKQTFLTLECLCQEHLCLLHLCLRIRVQSLANHVVALRPNYLYLHRFCL